MVEKWVDEMVVMRVLKKAVVKVELLEWWMAEMTVDDLVELLAEWMVKTKVFLMVGLMVYKLAALMVT